MRWKAIEEAVIFNMCTNVNIAHTHTGTESERQKKHLEGI